MRWEHGDCDYDMDDTMSCSSCQTDVEMEEHTEEFTIGKIVDGFTAIGSPALNPLPLNLIQQGTRRWNRVGNGIRMTRLRIRGFFDAIDPGSFGPLYIGVVYDRSPNMSRASMGTINNGNDQTGAQIGSSFLNPDEGDRFLMLYEEMRWLPGSTSVGTPLILPGDYSVRGCILDLDVPLPHLESHYWQSSVPALIGDMTTGTLLFFAGSGAGVFSATMNWRLEFYDC